MTRRIRTGDSEETPLSVDLAAAAELPAAEEIKHWAHDQRIFISSVMDELQAERKAVAAAVRQFGAEPVWFEEFGGRDADPADAYTHEVASCSVYVGLLGQRYGRLLPDRFSATHKEYLFAEEHGLRISVYPLDMPDREGRTQAFLEEIWQFHTAPVVPSADLGSAVIRRLQRLGAEDLSPWCKLGDVVFRASSIVEGKEHIVVTTKVRSRDVAHKLDGMRAEKWNSFEGQFTAVGRSHAVRVVDLESTATAATARVYKLTLERREAQRDSLLDVSYGGMTTDDLTEKTIRAALFGEQPPREDHLMGSVTDIGDPLAPLRTQTVPDEILRPLAELLLAESLVGSGRITRITNFRLGANVAGRRRLELGWETRSRYSNSSPERRKRDGFVALAGSAQPCPVWEVRREPAPLRQSHLHENLNEPLRASGLSDLCDQATVFGARMA